MILGNAIGSNRPRSHIARKGTPMTMTAYPGAWWRDESNRFAIVWVNLRRLGPDAHPVPIYCRNQADVDFIVGGFDVNPSLPIGVYQDEAAPFAPVMVDGHTIEYGPPAGQPNAFGGGLPRCHAGSDGDCEWKDCPQLRDGEPKATGRHCPIDTADKYEEG